MKNLYLVTVTYSAYVMAENQREADDFADDIVRDGLDPEVDSEKVYHTDFVDNNFYSDIPYGADKTVKEILDNMKEEARIERLKKEYEEKQFKIELPGV